MVVLLCACSTNPSQQPSTRLYVFDCGELIYDDISFFGLTNAQTKTRRLFVPCYLIEHAKGHVLWEAGLDPQFAGRGTIETRPGASMRYDRSLLDQLADMGIRPSDIDYIALSHMHFDHAGAANSFYESHLLIQEPEFIAAFKNADQYPVFDQRLYHKLADNPKTLLNGDLDLFGDGEVVLVAAPGHTPGHQVLLINLKHTGPVLLSGDLYHFRESRALRAVPIFNYNAPQTRQSMKKIENLLQDSNAQLWIEHDLSLAKSLRLAPEYYD